MYRAGPRPVCFLPESDTRNTIWTERRIQRRFPFLRFRGFAKVLRNGQIGQRAAQALLQHLGEKEASLAIRRLLWWHGTELSQDDSTHGLMTYALVCLSAPRSAVKWFGNWRERASAPPWALLNLTCALRDLGRDEESRAVSSHALTLPPDNTFMEHRVWLAYDAARRGDGSEAETLLSVVDEKQVTGYYQFIIAITRFHLVVGRPDPTSCQAKDEAWLAVRRAWTDCFLFQTALLRMGWRASKITY